MEQDSIVLCIEVVVNGDLEDHEALLEEAKRYMADELSGITVDSDEQLGSFEFCDIWEDDS